LNKLAVTGPVWLASDIHLGPDNPKTAEAFFTFLDQAGAQAGALFLLVTTGLKHHPNGYKSA
jgi:UDP-2,3-diacylglucosamine hydrolase